MANKALRPSARVGGDPTLERLLQGFIEHELVGLVLTRYVVEVDAVTRTSTSELIDAHAPALADVLHGHR